MKQDNDIRKWKQLIGKTIVIQDQDNDDEFKIQDILYLDSDSSAPPFLKGTYGYDDVIFFVNTTRMNSFYIVDDEDNDDDEDPEFECSECGEEFDTEKEADKCCSYECEKCEDKYDNEQDADECCEDD